MAFLGRKELIPYGGKGKWIWGRRVPGTRLYFGVNKKGLFQPYWEEKGEPAKTPGQRAQKRWQLNERRFRRFEAGVASASRGVRLAQLRARQKDVPSLQRVLEFFDNEVRKAIISQEFFSLEKVSSAVQEELLRHGFTFVKTHKKGLQEACAQIYFLIQGIGGEVNVGAFLARATAVTDRFRERLAGIYVWSQKYADEEQVLAAIQKQFNEVLEELNQQLRIWRRHEVFSRGRTSELQRKILQDKMAIVVRHLTPYVELQPFAGWVWFTINDLNKAGEAAKKGDWDTSRAVLARIGLSLEIKKKQRELDDLLWHLDTDEARGSWDGEFYLKAIAFLREAFGKLAEREKTANFKKPVCQEILKCLNEAKVLLPEKNFRKLKEPLKKAYLLL